jgi:hypothetical protein
VSGAMGDTVAREDPPHRLVAPQELTDPIHLALSLNLKRGWG